MFHLRLTIPVLGSLLLIGTLCLLSEQSSHADAGFKADFLAARTVNLVPTPQDVLGNAKSIVLGDFNEDGKSDIAVPNYSSPTVSVVLANGDGTFGQPTRYSVGSFPVFVLVRDFNSDGNLDLAVVNSDKTPGLSLLLGDGTGGFGAASGFSTGASPSYAAAADFNSDGKLDLVVTNSATNNLSLLTGDGNGSFSAPANFAVGTNPRSVAVGDFNGDTKPDLAVANFGSGNVQVLLGNGAGGFAVPLSIVTAGKPIHVALNDLNGDGKLDMVVANLTTNNVSVYLGNGAGAFAAPTNYPTESRPFFTAVADLNGDGKLDLAIAADITNNISILLGDGTGQFSAAPSVQGGPIPVAIGVDDFNGDGRADLAVANSNAPYVWILSGRGDGSFLTAPSFPTDSPTYAAVIADFNNDGKPDLATSNGGNTTSVLLGDGTGSFGPPATYGVGLNSRCLAVGDFNNDGKFDLVVGNVTDVSILLGNGTGSFGPANNFNVGGFVSSVATGDVDGDGKPDIVVAANDSSLNPADVTILMGDGVGGFLAPIRLTAHSEARSVVISDFNHDGKSDIAMTTGTYVSIIMGNGSRNFGPATSYLMQNNGTPSAAYGLTLGDFNGDSKTDLAVAIGGGLAVLPGNADGTFAPAKNSGGFGNVVVAGDFDGDGKSDVVMTNFIIDVLSGVGDGTFGTRTGFAAGAATTNLAAGDLNGDGKSDLVATDGYQSKVFILLNQAGSSGPAHLQFSSGNYSIIEGNDLATITVIRDGDTSTTVSAGYYLTDGSAEQRSDYVNAVGTLTFAPGETSKTLTVPVVDDAYIEGSETVKIRLGSLAGNVVLGNPANALLTIVDNDSAAPTTNPNDDAQFFVRQHYYDFLNRSPDSAGLTFWTGQITQCGSDQICTRNKRIDVSNAFFYELEFQQTGSYVYRLYRAAFGNSQPFANPIPDPDHPGEEKKVMSYQVFADDRARVVGGTSLPQSQSDLANAFVQRPQFIAKYPANLSGPEFVDALIATVRNDIGVDLISQRTALIALYNSAGRGAVLYRLADDNVQTNPVDNRTFIDGEYNRAFVATQYFGYLRRDADMAGFLFWLSQVNAAPLRNVTKQHAMVCSFTTSTEYQERFSSVVTHSNAECQ